MIATGECRSQYVAVEQQPTSGGIPAAANQASHADQAQGDRTESQCRRLGHRSDGRSSSSSVPARRPPLIGAIAGEVRQGRHRPVAPADPAERHPDEGAWVLTNVRLDKIIEHADGLEAELLSPSKSSQCPRDSCGRKPGNAGVSPSSKSDLMTVKSGASAQFLVKVCSEADADEAKATTSSRLRAQRDMTVPPR